MNIMNSGVASGDTSSTAISFASGESTLGQVLVAHSARGVCAILIGDDEEDLEADLGRRFPEATIKADLSAVQDDLSKVIRFIDGSAKRLDLPLDPHGTAFQRRVWESLRTIPSGTTTTYSELACKIGKPRAVRAVAGACAANPIALAIPCHRVVRNDGGLAGYAWGIHRKRALIEKEAVA